MATEQEAVRIRHAGFARNNFRGEPYSRLDIQQRRCGHLFIRRDAQEESQRLFWSLDSALLCPSVQPTRQRGHTLTQNSHTSVDRRNLQGRVLIYDLAGVTGEAACEDRPKRLPVSQRDRWIVQGVGTPRNSGCHPFKYFHQCFSFRRQPMDLDRSVSAQELEYPAALYLPG